ncbi:MAG TPA: retron system putative HNH endonuclease [Candidatus Nanopelagicales bacterium]|nr:retron system putative HNH endonuclease [Candidatus Nanopelagicales bacterium]
MRAIHKTQGHEPPELAEFKAAANEDWTPTYGKLTSVEKDVIRKALLAEQGFLCCYCGSRIGETKDDCHIEHLLTQKDRKDLALDYGNMLGSCQPAPRPGAPRPVPEQCGHKRGTAKLEVTPLQPDCEAFFAYRSSGEILPADDTDRAGPAERTIKALALHVDKLRAARAAAIGAALDGLEGLSDEEALRALAMYESPDATGRLFPFCFAISAVLRQYVPDGSPQGSTAP